MKTITHRNSTRSAFLSGACLVLLAVPCVSLGEVKITASRDYVDKKVAAAVTNLTAYVDGSVTNAITNLQAQIGALPTAEGVSDRIDSLSDEVDDKIEAVTDVVDELSASKAESQLETVVTNIVEATFTTNDIWYCTISSLDPRKLYYVGTYAAEDGYDGNNFDCDVWEDTNKWIKLVFDRSNARWITYNINGSTASRSGVESAYELQFHFGEPNYYDLIFRRYASYEIVTQVSKVVYSGDLATVATTGSYNDLGDKPTIPTINSASTSQKGIVQLSSSTNSASEAMAATPKAVKAVRDEASALEQRVGQLIQDCAQKSDLDGYVKLSDVTNIVMNIVIAKYGNVAWKTEDAGQTLDAFYHELPYTDGVTTNATRTVQGQDSYLKFENGNITVYSSSTNAVPHTVEDSGR